MILLVGLWLLALVLCAAGQEIDDKFISYCLLIASISVACTGITIYG